MTRAALFVGGPLDATLRDLPAGVRVFEAVEPAEDVPWWTGEEPPPGADVRVKTCTYKRERFRVGAGTDAASVVVMLHETMTPDQPAATLAVWRALARLAGVTLEGDPVSEWRAGWR